MMALPQIGGVRLANTEEQIPMFYDNQQVFEENEEEKEIQP